MFALCIIYLFIYLDSFLPAVQFKFFNESLKAENKHKIQIK